MQLAAINKDAGSDWAWVCVVDGAMVAVRWSQSGRREEDGWVTGRIVAAGLRVAGRAWVRRQVRLIRNERKVYEEVGMSDGGLTVVTKLDKSMVY